MRYLLLFVLVLGLFGFIHGPSDMSTRTGGSGGSLEYSNLQDNAGINLQDNTGVQLQSW